MEGPTFEHIPVNPEKVTREQLLAFAADRPAGDPEVVAMFLKWAEETSEIENPTLSSLDRLDIALMQTTMKYRLDLISKEDVLAELEETGYGLASESGERKEGLHYALSQLMYDIEDNTFPKRG